MNILVFVLAVVTLSSRAFLRNEKLRQTNEALLQALRSLTEQAVGNACESPRCEGCTHVDSCGEWSPLADNGPPCVMEYGSCLSKGRNCVANPVVNCPDARKCSDIRDKVLTDFKHWDKNGDKVFDSQDFDLDDHDLRSWDQNNDGEITMCEYFRGIVRSENIIRADKCPAGFGDVLGSCDCVGVLSKQSDDSCWEEAQPPVDPSSADSCTNWDDDELIGKEKSVGGVVPDGWRGSGTGDNACNDCGCDQGTFWCTEDDCAVDDDDDYVFPDF